ncbi:hypothetical protein SRABI27_04809 [Pedobacter sp. Bi27]|uniref:hypothetical protein n=1 Tax=Pedobacter sp. Bi27 TaxID=2822351 RepID=UPI001D5F25B7|nr:hypothetical protein [Pedobacter sp. Bi27]CAH0311678.1 hypothetical protein SRABI27_04809 [Pedobacter sp. Bi27]
MENKKTDQQENRVCIVPHSQIEASDADSAYQDEASAKELSKQAAKSDSDTDRAEDSGTPHQN